MKWSVGITSCFRYESFLENTIQQVSQAGWDNVLVFAEPGTDTKHTRSVQYGCWTNWICSLYEMFQLGFPDTKYYLILEDDINICKNVRVYLEEILPPLDRFGIVSLYSPDHISRKSKGMNCIHDESSLGRFCWGTQAIIFNNESIELFLKSERTFYHKLEGENKNRDSAIGMWALDSGKKVYYHTPSLVQHVGEKSTIDHDFHEASDFVGIDFDATSLLGKVIEVPKREILMA